jgi:hypothetical protein
MVTREAKSPHRSSSLRTLAKDTPADVQTLCAAPENRTNATVLAVFADSITIRSAAKKLDLRWLAFGKDRTNLAASAFRFLDESLAEELATLWNRLRADELPVEVSRQQREMVLMEIAATYATKLKPR